MRGYDYSTATPPRKWVWRGTLILLALFALMAHSIVHSGTACATGVSPVAIAVYGQGNYTSSSASAGTGGLATPHAVALDSNGDLYVADTDNNRVLYFPVGSTTATRVYGQSDISGHQANGNAATPDASHLNQPEGVALDSNDNLYVADTSNNRQRVGIKRL